MQTGFVRRNIKGDKRQMELYFDAVKERFAEVQSTNGYAPAPIVLNMAGRLLEVAFGSREIEEKLMPSLAGQRVPGVAGDAGSLYFWRDAPANYCPQVPEDDYGEELWRHQSEWAEVMVPIHKRYYRGWHFSRKEFFYCLPENGPLSLAHTTHPFRLQLHPWAQSQGLLFVHGAAVEIEGCGVFFGSTGERGKSTLALSCLLAGHGFAGDDYVLLDKNGAAHMVYGTGYLKPDMLERMPALQRAVIARDPARNDKTLLDLGSYARHFKSRIPLNLFIVPRVSGVVEPAFRVASPARALWEVVRSTAEQNGARADRDFMRAVFDRLSPLPVYEFFLTSDVDRNRNALEHFVTRRKNVPA